MDFARYQVFLKNSINYIQIYELILKNYSVYIQPGRQTGGGWHHMQGTKTVYYLLYIIEEYTFHGGPCFHFFNIMKEN